MTNKTTTPPVSPPQLPHELIALLLGYPERRHPDDLRELRTVQLLLLLLLCHRTQYPSAKDEHTPLQATDGPA